MSESLNTTRALPLRQRSITQLLVPGGIRCSCGKVHSCSLRYFRCGRGALASLPEALKACGCKRPFVVMDGNTKKAAGDAVLKTLAESGVEAVPFVFPAEGKMEPDEAAVGALTMAFDPSCDVILAVGSGVINDCCKVAAHAARLPSMVVCTAPSMDGYCSNNASMIQNRIKVSLYNACPVAIIADTDILKTAPDVMLQAGLGDMLAKYGAICEWRFSHLIHGDPYCEEIADLMRGCLEKIVSHADGLMRREDDALEAVLEGLVVSGIAMSFAGISRPASGLEHYFSHIWEMKALQRGEDSALHGIQVGVGTQLTLWLFENMLQFDEVDRERALRAMDGFSQSAWEASMRRIFGAVAPSIIRIEQKFRKNDPEKQKEHLEIIASHWQEIRAFMREELPARKEIIALMRRCGMPVTPKDLGLTRQDTVDALKGSREIRDKYLTSSLLWDLGMLEEAAERIPWDE